MADQNCDLSNKWKNLYTVEKTMFEDRCLIKNILNFPKVIAAPDSLSTKENSETWVKIAYQFNLNQLELAENAKQYDPKNLEERWMHIKPLVLCQCSEVQHSPLTLEMINKIKAMQEGLNERVSQVVPFLKEMESAQSVLSNTIQKLPEERVKNLEMEIVELILKYAREAEAESSSLSQSKESNDNMEVDILTSTDAIDSSEPPLATTAECVPLSDVNPSTQELSIRLKRISTGVKRRSRRNRKPVKYCV